MLIRRNRIVNHAWTAGCLLALLAVAALACQDAIIKSLVDDVSVCQLLCVRSVFIAGACLAAGGPRLLGKIAVSPVKRLLLGRSVVSLAAWLCYFTAAKTLSLPQLTTLYAAAPVMAVLLAIPLLGEPVRRHGWLATVLGFCGVVAASLPISLAMSPATLLVLLGAAFWAGGTVTMRRIGRREAPLVQLLANNLLFLVVTGLGSATSWRMPGPNLVLPLLGMGLLGGLGQLCLIGSARLAPVWLTAPLQYSGLLWAFLLGYVVWNVVPAAGSAIGALLICAAGIILLRGAMEGGKYQSKASASLLGKRSKKLLPT